MGWLAGAGADCNLLQRGGREPQGSLRRSAAGVAATVFDVEFEFERRDEMARLSPLEHLRLGGNGREEEDACAMTRLLLLLLPL